MSNPLRANFKLGFLGAGQLARMTALQAFRYGIQVRVFSDRQETEPVQLITPHSTTGSFDQVEQMAKFAAGCDVVTLENEFIDSEILRQVQSQSGTPIHPSPESFARIENKRIEKETFESAGIPVAPWRVITHPDDLEEFGREHGWPFLLKSSKGGYDGYGNKTVRTPEDALKAFRELGGSDGREILAEAFVEFTHELAVQVALNQSGIAVYPCCETVQENHICVAVRTPAPVSDEIQKRAQEMAVAAAKAINGTGIFAFELFLKPDGSLVLNESAPRPHNSGHYTIEGCITSQFENHLRAVLGLPLGPTDLRTPAVVMANLLGTHNRPAEVEASPEVLSSRDTHLHVYGKLHSKTGRKMGHLTLLGDEPDQLYKMARQMADTIRI